MAEPLVKTLLSTTKVVVRNLPGVPPVPKARFSPGWIAAGNVVAIVVAAVLAAVGAPGWTLLVPALATVPLTLLTVRHALRATGASKRIERDTPAALRAYAPAFVVYYAATQGARYQLGMWLPYLERLDKPYVVITRNPATVGEIATHDQEADPGAAHRQEDVGPPGLDGGAVDEGRVLRPGQPGQLDLPAVSDDPRLAQPRRLGQAGQLPPAARDVQQAVRVRAAGRGPLRHPRHRGAARPVRDRRSAADRDDHGPRRAAATRDAAHRPLRADLARAVGPAPTTARCRTA